MEIDTHLSDLMIKTENVCKICDATEGTMIAIPCKATDRKLVKKILNCTNVRVSPVEGAISPVCEACQDLINSFDENAKPIYRDFVVKAEINIGNGSYDPLCEAPQINSTVDLPESDVRIQKLPEIKSSEETNSVKHSKTRKKRLCNETKSANITEETQILDKLEDGHEEKANDGSDWEWPESDAKNDDNKTKESKKRRCGRPKLNSGFHEKCEICGKIVKRLREHLRRHKQTNHLKCTHCERTFSTRFSLNYHIRTHTGERPYVCKLCGNAYMSPSHLAMHMNTHSEEQKYQCHICSKRFNQSFKLTQHLKTHTGIKPHDCEICGKAFLRRHNRDLHMKRHKGEKNFVCAICSKRFVIIYALERHMKAHEKYDSTQNSLLLDESASKCDVCGKAFAKDRYMKAHKKRHFDERFQGRDRRLVKEPENSENDKEDYTCSICTKRFIIIEAFEKHMEGHERYEASQRALQQDERAFKCDFCGKAFTKDKYMKAHRKRHLEDNKMPKKLSNIDQTCSYS